MNPTVALTIAGSDSGAGAGLQADLKAFATQGVYGTTVVTAVTAQNTAEVLGVMAVAPDFVELQVEAVLSDLPVAAVKTGMLATTETVRRVARWASQGRLPNLVVDPVLVASTGRPLLEAGAERVYLRELLPHAVVTTPNMAEAALLTGSAVIDLDTMVTAAHRLAETGVGTIVVKGGHLGDNEPASDVVVTGGRVEILEQPRTPTANDHGTGCTLSAVVCARLARGEPVADAIVAAKRVVADALAGSAGWRLGTGHGPLDHFGWGAPKSF